MTPNAKQRIAELEGAIAIAAARVAGLEAEIARMREEYDYAIASDAGLRELLAEATTRATSLEFERDQAREDNVAANASIAGLNRALAEARAHLSPKPGAGDPALGVERDLEYRPAGVSKGSR